jgi:choline dehydrogenase-like flavoprotein
MMKPEYDLCVIGGGAAGLVVAAGGAGLGAKVLLVEKHRLGGDCLYYGCVPSKTLIATAELMTDVAGAKVIGPDEGFLACRWTGPGRLADPADTSPTPRLLLTGSIRAEAAFTLTLTLTLMESVPPKSQ